MIISVLGPAGVGKTTQADLIAKKIGFTHLSVGQLLRETHENHLNEYMKVGNLINPTVVNGLLQEKLNDLNKLETTRGIILDGYPRQIEQAEWLIDNYSLRIVILIDASIEKVTQRLLDRKRVDDNIKAIKNRLKIYKTQTEPTIEYLKSKGVFVLRIDGSGDIEDIHNEIMEQIKYVVTT